DVHPPESTPRPSRSSSAVADAPANSTGAAVRSLTSFGDAWTGTRSAVPPSVGVSTTRPLTEDTKSRGTPRPESSEDVGSRSLASVAGSAVSVTVTTCRWPAGTVTVAGVTVTVAPPAVLDCAKLVANVRDVSPVFCTVTVLRTVTVSAPTGTTPNATDTWSESCDAYARVVFAAASTASTRPEPTRSGP